MKKVLSILMVAFSMIAFVSCDKEGEGSADSLADNTLVYDGHTYTFDNVVVDYYHSALTLMSAYTSDTLEYGSPKLMVDGIHIMPAVWNKTLDLTNTSQWPEDVMVALHLYGLVEMNFEAWNNGGNMGAYGNLDGVDYEDESIFSSGTYTVMGNNDGTPITVTYDGTLKNGKKLQLKLVSGNYNVSK